MGRINNEIKEEMLQRYPKADFRGSDCVFDNFEDFERHMQNISERCEQDYPDFFVRLANECEIDEVADWIERVRRDEGNSNIDYIVGIDRRTHDFFTMARFECEE